MAFFSFSPLKRFLRETFLLGLVISLTIYGWVRLLFIEMPFSVEEDAVNLFKIVLSGWILVILLKGSFYALLAIGGQLENLPVRSRLKYRWVVPFIVVITLCTLLIACTK